VVGCASDVKSAPAKRLQLNPKSVDRLVGSRIRMRRLQRWLSHEQLARALRISPKELRDHERAVKRASCGRLYEIADALQVPITYLLFQSCTYGWRSLRMSLLWLCYRSREGGIRVVVQEATSLVHARLKVAVAGLAEHDAYTEGHHLMRACRSERPRS